MGATECWLVPKLVTAAVLVAVVLSLEPPEQLVDLSRATGLSPRLNLLVVTMHGPYLPVANPSDQAQPLQLTEKGKDLMQHVGELLMMRYEDHFIVLAEQQRRDRENVEKMGDPERPNVIQVTAIDKEIAKKSAEEIITGIKRQGKDLGKKLKIELSTENIDRNQFFDPLRLRNQVTGSCKEFDLKARSLKDPTEPGVNIFGQPKEDRTEKVFQEFDSLQMKYLEEAGLPEWTKTARALSQLPEMRKIVVTRMRSLVGEEPPYWKFFISSMLHNIFEEFKIPKMSEVTPSVLNVRKAHLHIHVVDAHLMSALVLWLRVESTLAYAYLGGSQGRDFYPQVGDSLIFEIDDQLYMKAFYMRAVAQMFSQKGWNPLSFETKIAKDFAGLAFRNQDGSCYIYNFIGRLFSSKGDWQSCCEQNQCG